MKTTAVSFNNVNQKYISLQGETIALQDIHFIVADGEFVSIVGPSGCGKSTMLSLIAGLFETTQGDVQLYDESVTGPTAKVGYMLQQDYLLPWMTIFENVTLGLEIQGTKTPANTSLVVQLLEEMGLADTANKYPHQLSGGMRQRAALVRTLAIRPKILLLDEPFSALDYQIKLQLEDLIFDTLRRHQMTAILVTHDLSEAIAMSDRIVVMGARPGRIKKIVDVPPIIRDMQPLLARDHTDFHQLFHSLWGDFQDEE